MYRYFRDVMIFVLDDDDDDMTRLLYVYDMMRILYVYYDVMKVLYRPCINTENTWSGAETGTGKGMGMGNLSSSACGRIAAALV